ncbi:MAG: phosphoglycerate mutase (2,3-diphosphoglycerate-independent) [Elusimicrobia bacterium GWC2_51_8]|nr:MAG: phosphoglycerate mutase (2,3-diphosphoglycerate-independent) [Elusimicrobia bacterium GWA2_51_34]OGR60298.1 MAG: phosphoglycerate mutase (2,3-diphosphoglycerate-independent) [Elusimicrobia bacterium GWC2_51_8]OGR85880.1 MAG: phosphoglycerate mutase (2,3-diphosphoglycerate-independent) [Elusimicrobia bacterium GWF2_52_66]HAF96133.1 2,3-bisphosphoglycerate-independent phosphoglycerate mutase [Elusimicrobiota bacterium]HCE97743.1 2,3-bisphosphoglycerate-independent phosphoglycerate mutase 
MAKKKVLLIVRDGWGMAEPDKFNAVDNAKKPNMDRYLKEYPNSVLEAAGIAVGLPKGYQGSSEVGHLNMGAGRIVIQELKRIMDMIEDGTFFKTAALKNAIDNAVKNNSALHLMGLVQDEGVHAHQDHLYAIMRHAAKSGVKQIRVHFFADGRDTPPRSALSFLKMLEEVIKEVPEAEIGTIMGRYYAMDRGEKWKLTDQAYNAITKAEGARAATAEEAINRAYADLKNPNGQPIVDEYLPPTIISGYKGMKDGDSVVHFNFRQDRAIQLTKAFVEDNYAGARWKKLNITYCGLTRYYDSFKFSALPPMDEGGGMDNLLGQIISNAGLKQLRLAETQKFKHVTSFFNGKRTEPYKNEDQVEIMGAWDPSSFGEHPEMNAPEAAERALTEIASERYDFILVNFANGDMVGHTGIYEAAVKAIEVVDGMVGRLVDAALEHGYTVMVTSDHGNAEEMWDYKINMPKTAHTTNPVEFFYIAGDISAVKLRQHGILSDIAPTVLETLGLPKPGDMTSESLIVCNKRLP